MRILAVVVTHNRSSLLDRCLTYINNQILKPTKILVINNGSTDNTSEIIRKHDALEFFQENIGSAGGWYAGIDFCMKNDFDACWLMDDDGYPDKGALKILSEQINESDACVSSCVLKESKSSEFVFPLPRLNSRDYPVLFSLKRKYYRVQDIKKMGYSDYNFVHLFNGALIPSSSIKLIGNITKEYFIMGDEVDYFFRLKSVGNVRTILGAKHYHPDVSKRKYTEIKIYYLLKNTIINHIKYFDLTFLRNISLFLVLFIRIIKRNGIVFLLRLLLSKPQIISKAISRGFNMKLGSDMKL